MDTIPKKTFFNLDSEKQQRITDAALNEFALRSYEEANISNIIKDAKIPRGSFYQYFENKLDLYKYVFDYIKEKKMNFLGNDLKNIDDLPFLEIFRLLYHQGVKFSYTYPLFVQIGKHMFNLKKDMYDELVGNGLKLAKEYYVGYLEADKLKGRIREDVDSSIFADIVIELTTNIAIEGISEDDIDLDKMVAKVDSLINIFKKGIEKGDLNV